VKEFGEGLMIRKGRASDSLGVVSGAPSGESVQGRVGVGRAGKP
jgi:hypothetical protein